MTETTETTTTIDEEVVSFYKLDSSDMRDLDHEQLARLRSDAIDAFDSAEFIEAIESEQARR